MAFDDRTQHAARRDELYQDPQYQDPFRTQWNGAAGTTGAGAGATYAADPQPWESRTSLDTRHDTERHAGEYRDNSPIEMRPLVKDYNASDALDSTQQQPPIAPTVREQLLFASGVDRFLRLIHKGKSENLTQAIHRKRMGIGGQRWPIITWGLTAIMTVLLIYELIANKNATGSVISTSPFNYMIGPSSQVLISIGARYVPCIKPVAAIPPSFSMTCVDGKTACALEEICGHGGFPNDIPNQSWRLFSPIFLHVGVVHLLLNMFMQVTAGALVERLIGSLPFLLIYLTGGIYGNILGGSFALVGIPSAGASGALFSAEAVMVVDLIMHWQHIDRPGRKAVMFAIELAIIIAIGYIPNAVDGLAHLGGFAMGLLLGVICIPAVSGTMRHKYIVWGVRVAALVVAILALGLTTKNFYTADPNAACTWCKFLSCWPAEANARCQGTGLTTTRAQA